MSYGNDIITDTGGALVGGLTVSVQEFAKKLGLNILYEGRGSMQLAESEINRPGLQLSGFFAHFANMRVQLLGYTETYFMEQLAADELDERLKRFFSYDIPCIVFSRGYEPKDYLIEHAKASETPLFNTQSITTKVNHSISNYIERQLAPVITRHGVLLDIYGVGVMLMGESGMGKSETALELVKRGHRIVADDVVEIRRVTEKRLSGTAPALTRHLLEIRGIGLIDVRYMYGVGAVIAEKSIDIVIEMEMWQEGKNYDRLGLDEEKIEILDVKIPRLLIPVRPGRNLAIIVEVAARNFRLKGLGYNAAKEFDKRWMEELENFEDLE